MGRADIGSAKFQAKQLKASGLQKLRYYCQLCQKQCRDANGFKNHLLSPSHTGRISNLSSEGKGTSVVEGYSAQFEKDFMRLLKINHGTKKINANKFYQEYILNDKNHVHMNATRWLLLTSFVKYLGRLGKIRVDVPEDLDEEFNLVIRLVDDTGEQQLRKKDKIRQTDEERALKFLESQVLKGKEMEAERNSEEAKKAENGDSQQQNDKTTKPLQPPTKVKMVLKGRAPRTITKPAAFANDSEEE